LSGEFQQDELSPSYSPSHLQKLAAKETELNACKSRTHKLQAVFEEAAIDFQMQLTRNAEEIEQLTHVIDLVQNRYKTDQKKNHLYIHQLTRRIHQLEVLVTL
jgi:predicted RNase H-like nuclease (RuvC/YqgF family)